MAVSGFGVEDFRISKSQSKRDRAVTMAAGGLTAGGAITGAGGYAVKHGAAKDASSHLQHWTGRGVVGPDEIKRGQAILRRHKIARGFQHGGTAAAVAGGATLATQALLSRKKPVAKADRRGEVLAGGAAAGGAAITTRSALHALGGAAAAHEARGDKAKQLALNRPRNVDRLTRKVRYLTKVSRAQAGAAGAGALATGAGLIGFAASRRARKQSNSELTKAFDSERSRHSRQNLYVGGLTGGAVVAGAGSAKAGYHAVDARKRSKSQATAAEAASRRVGDKVTLLSKPVKAGGHAKSVKNIAALGAEHGHAMSGLQGAARVALKGRRLTRVSVASALGAAALGGGAVGVHRYDRHGRGQSYWN